MGKGQNSEREFSRKRGVVTAHDGRAAALLKVFGARGPQWTAVTVQLTLHGKPGSTCAASLGLDT